MSLLNHLNVLFLACLILLKLVKYPSCLVFDLPRRQILLALDIFIVLTELSFSLGHMSLAKSAREHLFRFVFPFLYMLPVLGRALWFNCFKMYTLCSAPNGSLSGSCFATALKKRHAFTSHFSSRASTSTNTLSVRLCKPVDSNRQFSPWLLSPKETKPTSCTPPSTCSPCGSSKTASTYLRVDTFFKS